MEIPSASGRSTKFPGVGWLRVVLCLASLGTPAFEEKDAFTGFSRQGGGGGRVGRLGGSRTWPFLYPGFFLKLFQQCAADWENYRGLILSCGGGGGCCG